jgi:cytochrome c553
MRKIARQLFAATAILAASGMFAAAAEDAAGKRIYREGMLPSGEPLRGTVRNGVTLSGAAAACTSCHRHSGLGGGEGQNTVRPIAGRFLFESRQLPAQRSALPHGDAMARPAYTRATLARALREGIDPSGRTLDALMPRFDLGDDDINRLADHLEQLAPLTAPGVTGSEIHFATVVAAGVPAEQEKAMLDVLQAFFSVKNSGTRREHQRAEVGRSLPGSEQMYRGYRSWKLHVWKLDGPPEAWAAQLAAHYRQQPVFALLSGIGAHTWRPVHEFCEQNEIPCLFPNVDIPVADGGGYATLYFSRGLALEAEVLARHLADAGQGDGAIVQVFRDDDGGRMAAGALRAAMRQHGLAAVVDRPLTGGQPAPLSFWARLLETDRPKTLILWLNDTDIADFPAQGKVPPWLDGLYLSASLADAPGRFGRSGDWLEKVRIVYPFELPERFAQRLSKMKVWLRARNVPLTDERIQANTYFTAIIAGDALAHMDDNFSRDYFIERVERMTEQSLFPAVYPRLSLGPGQRYASRGGYVAGFARDGGNTLTPLGGWIVP